MERDGAQNRGIESIYRRLFQSKEREEVRTKEMENGDMLKISRSKLGGRVGYFVSLGGFRCYITEEGVSWITMPSAKVKFGSEDFTLSSPIMASVRDKSSAAEAVCDWLEECIDAEAEIPLDDIFLR